MRWLPRISIESGIYGDETGDAEGSLITLLWGPFIISFEAYRRT